MVEGQAKRFSVDLMGKKIDFEVGKLASLADGAVMVSCEGTDILVTAIGSKQEVDRDFFPLTVDVEERMYAAGKIPGGFFRREGRPSEKSILTARLIDRPLRPNFPQGMRIEVQVIATILSVDQVNKPDVLALNGASAALCISDIPFNGPLGAVRVGLVDGSPVINPTIEQMEESDLDLVVVGLMDQETNEVNIIMVEANGRQIPERDVVDAMDFAKQGIREMIRVQQNMVREVGRKKREVDAHELDLEAVKRRFPHMEERVFELVEEMARNQLQKADRESKLDALLEDYLKQAEEGDAEEDLGPAVKGCIDHLLGAKMRRMIVEEDLRVDGRRRDEIRPVSCETGMISRTHGSGLFARGLTQVLTLLTLGPISDMQRIDDLSPDETKRYMHHYNFPPFSVGEARPLRGPRRREIGHGALAERALVDMIPDETEFPYTIRLVSEVLSSNGSTSMASVCASSLALMDAGVPLKDNKAVAGIAMGLIKEQGEVRVLTDIQGIEDKHGDMDFKVAGTDEGITALQMDMKIHGITTDTVQEALEQARDARMYILRKMREVISAPRSELSPYAPRVLIIEVPVDKIREVIGPGGKVIHRIVAEHDVEMDIEDDGRVFITAKDLASARGAQKMVEQIIREARPGEQYEGTVTRTMNFGAFVEYLPGKEGLIHISKLSDRHVTRVEDVVNVGDRVKVEVSEIDDLGRVNLRGIDIEVPEEAISKDRGHEKKKHDSRKSSRRQQRHSGTQGDKGSKEGGKDGSNPHGEDRKNW